MAETEPDYELWTDRFENSYQTREYRSECENENCSFSIRWFAADPQEPSEIECPICGGVVIA